MPSASEVTRFALPPGNLIALAVSGGPDSLALLLLAAEARPGAVIAATVDHGLRPEATAEAAKVAAVCAARGVPHTILKVTVPDDPVGLQAAARSARYSALADWCEASGAKMLVTGHHADDQAETVLMRLARGAGLAGVSGIRPARPLDEAPGVTLVRPLLGWRKAELEAIVAAAGLIPVRDPSNADPRFDRTRARALLAQGWPAAERVAASARWLGEAEEALEWTVTRLADERIVGSGSGLTIDVQDLPRELRRRLLLAGFDRLGARTPRGDSLDQLLRSIDAGAVATLAGIKADPGPPWRLAPAPPRRSH